jgi:Mu-like prophage DNA circulation protein
MDVLVAGIADPGNAISLLGPLASYTPSTFGGSGVIGDAREVAQDATSALLRRSALRQAVVSALTTTGATLPALQAFSFRAPMPALVMASRLYQDAGRTDELIQQADPIHPAFMPTAVKALAR